MLVACGAAAGVLALHLRDPHEQGSWGLCPVNLLTGAACPGCGGLRAVNDLTRGDVAGAASSNLLLLLAAPALVLLWARWTRSRWSGEARPLSRRAAGALAVVAAVTVVAFTVLRNLPAGAWLAP